MGYYHDFSQDVHTGGCFWRMRVKGSGPWLVLIPSALGDPREYQDVIPSIITAGFTVVTFNMPGMSERTPSTAHKNSTAPGLASKILQLLDTYGVHNATFVGSGSGGAVALALAVHHPTRVRNAIVHEVCISARDFFLGERDLDDAKVEEAVARALEPQFPREASASFRAGVRENYARWVRGYGVSFPESVPVGDELRGRPVDWSVGADTPAGKVLENVVVATRAGIRVGVLPGRQFPYMGGEAATRVFVEHVVEATKKYPEVRKKYPSANL